jgi:hypothetical protein
MSQAEVSISQKAALEDREVAPAAVGLSAVIVNYNGRKLLPAALRALQANTVCPDTEIVIVDGGSTDGSVDDLSAGRLPVRVIRCGENVGFCRGNNIGAEAARGRLLVFTQGDGEVQPGWDLPLREALNDPGVAVAGGLVLKMSEHEAIDSAGLAIAPNLAAWSLNEWMSPEAAGLQDGRIREVIGVSPAFLAVRREDHLRVGGFWEKLWVYGDEPDYALRTRALGRAVLCPTSRMRHWVGGSIGQASALRIRLSSRNRLFNIARHLPPSRLVWALMLSAAFDALQLVQQPRRVAAQAVLQGWAEGLSGMRSVRALSTADERAANVARLTTLREAYRQQRALGHLRPRAQTHLAQ